MNERGQEFSGFRLLIDAILVLLILVIIIGVLGWVQSEQDRVSSIRLSEGFDTALNSPNGKTVFERDINLKEGAVYSSRSFADPRPGIKKECVKIYSADTSGFVVDPTNRQVRVTTKLQVDVYYRCWRDVGTGVCEDDCELCCEISFGKEFEEEE